jgi:hypothetical protein
MVDWSDPSSKISKYFTVGEATYLKRWNTHHVPSDEEKANIVEHAKRMDEAREAVGRPFKVHVWIRPTSANCPNTPFHGKNYNALVGGAKHSAHIVGKATDFDAGQDCDDTRTTLESKLEDIGLRMEKNPGSDWVHLDSAAVPPGGNRYFQP